MCEPTFMLVHAVLYVLLRRPVARERRDEPAERAVGLELPKLRLVEEVVACIAAAEEQHCWAECLAAGCRCAPLLTQVHMAKGARREWSIELSKEALSKEAGQAKGLGCEPRRGR